MGAEMIEKTIDEIISQVKEGLIGRFADAGEASKTILKVVELAGDGNYLEFGVLHGGSLCAVALYKKALGHTGICVGVDLFNGWYFNRTGKLLDKSGVPVTLDIVKTNVSNFDLDNIKLVQGDTQNFITDINYKVAFVDAGHSFESAWKDWLKVKDITTDFVIFHDYLLIKGVTKACNRASEDRDWTVFEKKEGVFVLRKIKENNELLYKQLPA
jgi:hypothetical protein